MTEKTKNMYIVLHHDTYMKLYKSKIHKRETFNDVIERLVKK